MLRPSQNPTITPLHEISGLIALSLGIDPAFVSTHHVVRIFLVVVLAPLAFRLLAPRLGIAGGK